MKKPKTSNKKAEQKCSKNKVLRKGVLTALICLVLGVILFVSGYCFSSKHINKEISNEEYELYEQIAKEVYEQGEKFIYEVPEDISLKKDDTTITISSKHSSLRGKVIARLQNGELVCERNEELEEAVAINILTGVLFVCFACMVGCVGWRICNSIKEKKLTNQ